MDTENTTLESSSDSVGDSDKSTTQGYLSSASSTPPPTFADRDRWQYHIELEDFTKGLQAAANAVFPNNKTSRYTKVFVLMLSWADEDPNLPVSLEIDRLNDVFHNIYHYETERWNIPAEDCHYKLAEKIMNFVKPTEESQTHLKIVYYAGHARLLDTRLLVWTSWQNNRKVKCPIVKWGGIQTILEEAPSDVLILLDCCASGTANASEGNGVNELISACAFNETANGVGPYSFTSALVTELRLLSDKASFSVGELYKKIFFRTQCRMPEEKYKDGTARERHPAPIHLLLTQGAPVPRSIQLSAFGARDLESSSENEDVNAKDLVGTPKDKDPPKEPSQIDSTLAMQKVPAESKGPRLIFAIRLKDTFRPEVDILDHFTDWMRSFPTIAHGMKVEAVFDSLSTLVLISLPMYIYAYLPQDPAILSLGPITSPNRMHFPCTLEHYTKSISWGLPEQNSRHATLDPPSSKAVKPRDLLVDNPPIPSLGPPVPTQYLTVDNVPVHPSRISADLKWGKLFDDEGKPTKRLSQFLRGLANHIINEDPKNLFITPSKMVSIYSRYSLDRFKIEPNQFFSIFKARSNEQISRLYQDLGCQHCLVQDDATGPPVIPALTSLGFAHWETIQILSYPGVEWQRLSKVVRDISILADDSIVDGKPEALPRRLSRHLFPSRSDRKARKLLKNVMVDLLNGHGSLTGRGVKPNVLDSFSFAFSAADLVQRHLRDRPTLKSFGDRRESVYSTSSSGSYGRGYLQSSSSRIDSSASSIFSVGLGRQYGPPSPPRSTLQTNFKEALAPLFTCLLDTCTASCPKGCFDLFHYYPFSCNRKYEMKIHLDAEHPYHDIAFPLPASWSKPYVQTGRGWECARCREFLGTWDARKETIEAHWEECSRRVTAEIVKDFDVKECARCEGLGTMTTMRQMGPNASRFQTLCLDCNGVGEVPRSRRPTFPV